jgi:hypothetical protein
VAVISFLKGAGYGLAMAYGILLLTVIVAYLTLPILAWVGEQVSGQDLTSCLEGNGECGTAGRGMIATFFAIPLIFTWWNFVNVENSRFEPVWSFRIGLSAAFVFVTASFAMLAFTV